MKTGLTSVFIVVVLWASGTSAIKRDVFSEETMSYDEKASLTSALLQATSEVNSGLSNTGSDCFMNAVCQALFYSVPFRIFLAQQRTKASSPAPVSKNLKEHFFKMLTATSPVSGGLLRANLIPHLQLSESLIDPWTGQAVTPERKRWGTQQQDAEEFLTKLLDAIGKESLPSEEVVDAVVATRIFEQYSHKEPDTNTTHQGRPMQTLYRVLSLPIVGNTLGTCLGDFFKTEHQADYQCSTCKKKVVAQKEKKIEQLPPLLIIQLKRFKVNYQRDSQNNIIGSQIKKLLQPIKIPELLEFHNTYQLRAIVVQRGSLQSGHYWTYAHVGNEWYCFNDSVVSKIAFTTMQNILNTVSVFDQLRAALTYVDPKDPSILKTYVWADQIKPLIDTYEASGVLPDDVANTLKTCIRSAAKLGPNQPSKAIERIDKIINQYNATPYLLFYERVEPPVSHVQRALNQLQETLKLLQNKLRMLLEKLGILQAITVTE